MQPVIQSRHGTPPRGLETTPRSSTDAGRFGRMFRRLGAAEQDPEWLLALADAMVGEGPDEDSPLGVPDAEENPRIPSAYTYFGQFVDHDLTFDPLSSLLKQNDPNALTSFRTPSLDLDSVYGRGPDDQPFAYEPPSGGGAARFIEGTDGDLPRAANGRAIVGDPRNDENQIVGRLHALFLRFHNVVAESMPGESFERVQREVRWHYQWVVVHDFLRRLAGDDVVEDILRPVRFHAGGGSYGLVQANLLFYDFRSSPFMPVEFSGAAYRLGHSMVRPSYHVNLPLAKTLERVARRDRGRKPPIPTPHRIPIFGPGKGPNGRPLRNLSGFGPFPADQWIDWRLFLETNAVIGGAPQPSYKLDTEISEPLADLATAGVVARAKGRPGRDVIVSLGARNLIRGLRLGLPSGQAVARAMGVTPLEPDELHIADRGSKKAAHRLTPAAKRGLVASTPLWYYVLREAEHLHGGTHLGPVGARIVAETMIGVLAADPTSFLGVEPNWTPRPDWSPTGNFTLADIARIATRGTFRVQ